jgi:hypothetical protein
MPGSPNFNIKSMKNAIEGVTWLIAENNIIQNEDHQNSAHFNLI